MQENLKDILDRKVAEYNRPDFIPNDPVSIPHRFSQKQDIEVMGFFAAILAWGQRKTIINKCLELERLMDGAPADFVKNHEPQDLQPVLHFKHRTFMAADLLYFMEFLQQHYRKYDSLEDAFVNFLPEGAEDMEQALIGFHQYFFSLEHLPRTQKHIATPARNASCKRLNMFLRWMVRNDSVGVDFGLWNRISSSQLLCPLDVHVGRVARKLDLLQRPQSDWKAVKELTVNLRLLDPHDPVKYDFALFGMGVSEEM